MIRRDKVARKSQIEWIDPATAQVVWLDLLDYRYGMSNDEVNQDVEDSGIDVEEWAFRIKVMMREECKSFNDKKLSPCLYYTKPDYYLPPCRVVAQ